MANNDHVDVHLLFTVGEHGQQPSCARFARWNGVQNGVGNKATYPMMAVFFRICFGSLVFVARF